MKIKGAIILPLFLISSILPEWAQAVATPPLTQCFIEIHDAHISTTFLKREGRLAVKVNAISICNVNQNKVTLTVEIYKEGFGGPHLVARASTRPEHRKSQGFVVKNQFTYQYCKNRKKTRYFGLAKSQATINGKTYKTTPVRSENTIQLDCGT